MPRVASSTSTKCGTPPAWTMALALATNVNAGILQFGHAADLGPDEWNRVIAVNLTGMFNMIRPALTHLEASQGNVVNVASS